MRISKSYAEFKDAAETKIKDEYFFEIATKNPDYNFILENSAELFSYRCFLLLVATENFQVTSKLFRMTPFGLSRRILGLQQKLRIKLVDSGEDWTITPEGFAFAKELAPRLEHFYKSVRLIHDLGK